MVGIGFVFATLLIIALLIVGMKRSLHVENRRVNEINDQHRVATMAAVVEYMDLKTPIYRKQQAFEESSRWKMTARLEALQRGRVKKR